ncbi:MAG: hypothetical protein MJA29_04345 [Candidatus Omnitrophica bacterium]|nr:hypothetical protein [Candidatus Omnitrophota bacterium]
MAIARGLIVDIALNTARIQRDIQKTQKSFGNLERSVKKMGAAVLKVTATIVGLQKAFQFANEAAKFDQAQQAFANLAASYEQDANSILQSLKQMSAGTISTAQLMESAGKAMLLGIPADQLVGMMEIARNASRITGDSIQKSFEDIATGMGRQSKLILDNLGIVVDTQKAYDDYAKSIGKTSSELDDAEKKQAFMNATLQAGKDIVRRVGADQLTAAEAMQKFKAQVENGRIVIGKALITITSTIKAIFNSIGGAFHFIIGAITDVLARMLDLASKLPGIGKRFDGLAESMRQLSIIEKGTAETSFKMADSSAQIALAIWKQKKATDGAIESTKIMNQVKKESVDLDVQKLALEADRKRLDDARKTTEEFEKQSQKDVLGDDPVFQTLEKQQADLDALEEYRQARLEIIHASSASELEIQMRQAALEEEIAKRKADIQITSAANMAGAIGNILQNLAIATGQREGKLFKAAKSFAIANALIKTYQGAANALATVPWPMNFVAAASVVAAGLAQVAKIKSSSPGGGGGGGGGLGGGGGGGAGLAPSIGQPIVDQPLPGDTRNLPSRNITVNIQNGSGTREYWQDLVEESIIPAINQAQDRNINLTVKET